VELKRPIPERKCRERKDGGASLGGVLTQGVRGTAPLWAKESKSEEERRGTFKLTLAKKPVENCRSWRRFGPDDGGRGPA